MVTIGVTIDHSVKKLPGVQIGTQVEVIAGRITMTAEPILIYHYFWLELAAVLKVMAPP